MDIHPRVNRGNNEGASGSGGGSAVATFVGACEFSDEAAAPPPAPAADPHPQKTTKNSDIFVRPMQKTAPCSGGLFSEPFSMSTTTDPHLTPIGPLFDPYLSPLCPLFVPYFTLSLLFHPH